MAIYCPVCWAKAHCIDSRCDPLTNTVRRRHECTEQSCRHRFTSVEIIVGAVDLRVGHKSTLAEIAWQIFDILGGDKADELFLDEWQKKAAAMQDRIREKRKERRAAEGAKPWKHHKPSELHPWRRMREVPKQ